MFEVISKEEAKRRIDASPSDEVVWMDMNRITLTHSKAKRIRKKEGKKLINAAEEVLYQNNDYFGTLSLCGVLLDKKRCGDDIIHNILFPQLE